MQLSKPNKNCPSIVFKYCPKCGKNSLNKISSNSISCKECNFLFYVNMSASVSAIITDSQNRILLTQRARNPRKKYLDLPGGFVNLFENAEEAIKREIKEELDLLINNYKYFCSLPNTYLYEGLTYYTLELAFLCVVSDITSLVAGDDVSNFFLFEQNEIPYSRLAFQSTRSIIKLFFSEL